MGSQSSDELQSFLGAVAELAGQPASKHWTRMDQRGPKPQSIPLNDTGLSSLRERPNKVTKSPHTQMPNLKHLSPHLPPTWTTHPKPKAQDSGTLHPPPCTSIHKDLNKTQAVCLGPTGVPCTVFDSAGIESTSLASLGLRAA